MFFMLLSNKQVDVVFVVNKENLDTPNYIAVYGTQSEICLLAYTKSHKMSTH